MPARSGSEALSPEALACLRALEIQPDTIPEQYSDRLLATLVAQGLVERVQTQALPVMPQRFGYRLTGRGRAVLAEAGAQR